MPVEILSDVLCFGGRQLIVKHDSPTVGLPMKFALFLPAEANKETVPGLLFLSGLTCTEENVTVKSGVQEYAAKHGIAFIAPDTSPRGENVPNDEGYDLGQGAGFYLTATQEPWAQHFKMDRYILDDLLPEIGENFPIDVTNLGITGHSMGGHGALTMALRNPDRFKSVSAFSPIVAPTQCPWGEKAFSAYLGVEDRKNWEQYDATALVSGGASAPGSILIDQGDADTFLEEQLKPQLFQQACDAAGQSVSIRMQEGYDHSYFFIATFIGDHVAHHAKALTS